MTVHNRVTAIVRGEGVGGISSELSYVKLLLHVHLNYMTVGNQTHNIPSNISQLGVCYIHYWHLRGLYDQCNI